MADADARAQRCEARDRWRVDQQRRRVDVERQVEPRLGRLEKLSSTLEQRIAIEILGYW
jgi:hypothetical protein